ncbi:MAG: RNA polymerase sigma-70 factor [Bacteroidales bacterium]|nr:RNA polymerase sigma-70 factor [Bacteroidales bacterium]
MANEQLVHELLLRIARDDAEAFSSLFNMYYPKVLQYSRYFVKSNESVEEIASDVFLKIWNNRKKLTQVNSLDGYIFTITKNKAFDYLDKISRLPDFISQLPFEIHYEDDNPENQLLAEELGLVIKDAVSALPPRCQAVFLLAREEGLSYSEIASALSISVKTVNAQMVTALKRMAEAIKVYFASSQ